MNKLTEHIVVIGAGIAGIKAIETLRQNNKIIKITLISNEDRLPYKRTKINKSIAKGFEKDDFKLHEENWYGNNNINLVYNTVVNINPNSNTITFADSAELVYSKLLLANGTLPFIPKIDGVQPTDFKHVQHANMVERIIDHFNSGKERYFILGGGIEGLETANQLIKLNKQVVVADMLENPLKHLFPDHIAKKVFHDLASSGIRLVLGGPISKIEKAKSGWIVTHKSERFEVDELIACTGTRPNIQLAQKAGLATKKGVLVNEYLQTSNPEIYAAGDVAEHSNGLITGLWHPAEKQGITAGLNLLGQKTIHKHIPFRLKSTLAGQFYFTGNFSPGIDTKYTTVKESGNTVYREIYHHNNQVESIIMVNDKERSKLYQQAVFEHWSLDKFYDTLPLPVAT